MRPARPAYHEYGKSAYATSGYTSNAGLNGLAIPMPKSVFGGHHSKVVAVLVEARKMAGLTQAQLGARVGKDQKFISLIERSQRRVDVLEFYALGRAMGADPVAMFAALVAALPGKLSI